MSFLMNIFFKKEEEPKPPPEPVKPPNIFGGLAVKTPVVVQKPINRQVLKQNEPVKSTEFKIEPNKGYKDPFEDLLNETPNAPVANYKDYKDFYDLKDAESHTKNTEAAIERKNDPNSIDFLLDLTMGDKSSQNPAPVIIKKANVIRNEVSSELRRGNVSKNFEAQEEGQGNLFAGITNVRTAQRVSELQGAKAASGNVVKVVLPDKEKDCDREKVKIKEQDQGGKDKGKKLNKNNQEYDSDEEKRHNPKSSKTLKSSKEPSPPPPVSQRSDPTSFDQSSVSHSPSYPSQNLEDSQKKQQNFEVKEEQALQDAFIQIQEEENLIQAEKVRQELEEQEKIKIELEFQAELQQKILEQQSNIDFILSQFNLELENQQKAITKISSEQLTLKDVQKNYQNDLIEMQLKEKDLENLASEAANNEDFDLAVQYSDERESLLLRIEFTQRDLEKKSEEYIQMELEKSRIYKEITELYKQTQNVVLDIKNDSETKLEAKQTELQSLETSLLNTQEKFSNEIKEKYSEVETIQNSLQEKKTEIETKMRTRTEPLQELKDKTQAKIELINNEIDEITKILQEKIRTREALENSFIQVSQELQSVPSEFEEDHQEVEIAEKLLQSESSNLDILKISTKHSQEGLETEINECKNIIIKISEKLNQASDTQTSLLEKFESIEKIVQTRQSSLAQIIENKENFVRIKKICAEFEQELKTFDKKAADCIEELKNHEKRIEEIKIKLPIMEVEKKTATVNKQFKDAARLNTEIKDMTGELQELIKIVEGLEGNLSELKVKQEEFSEKVAKDKEEIEKIQENIEKFSQELLV